MRRALLVLTLLLAACDGVMVLNVHNIPADATSVMVYASWMGKDSQLEYYYPPPSGFNASETLGFRFPSASDDVNMTVAAWEVEGSQVCITHASHTTIPLKISAGRNDLDFPLASLATSEWICKTIP